ncbi:MAG: peptidase M23B [Parcubacteria group bacterium Gr01-1014_48]|nr:MAG: peptidase M23B [Parcubacteria group bacterium Greene0416_14]TSC74074.1 MAG: peptidase M23B [Parcubacteria group bacterium Gr01-1014_48]TSD01139.1 MAG: peptidase M23B [Parcubacteria group bacterium Greene1014_15]TSD08215.1 MAG: peptidase M23B [Parcubacteria group bacterium Greene0714_4]
MKGRARIAIRFFLSALLAGCITLSGDFIFAQEQPVDSQVASRKAQLERELEDLEKKIDTQRSLVQEKQRERVTFERDVAILDANIEKARLGIKQRTIAISRLSDEIDDKETIISELDEKIGRGKESLAQLIRKTNEIDNLSLVEVVLGNKNLSEFFVDLDSFQSIKHGLQISFAEIRTTKEKTAAARDALAEKQSDEIELRAIQELQKKKIEAQEKEKQRILTASKGVEAQYQKVLKDQEKTAAMIRSELFMLRGSAAIPFGTALDLAKRAGKKIGIRPAFILGIIAEESNLGENVGKGNWQTDMHPTRDVPVFKDITARLGLDPDSVPVSKKAWYGWGGAMGPAQFIPSTWILYEKQLASLTGHNPPNPWDPGDAFMGAAILLADNGADGGTPRAERLAALRYLAGWKNATNPSYAFYGDEVMELAAKYQSQIDILDRLQ